MTPLKNKPKAAKYSDHRTQSKALSKDILRKQIERKTEDVLGEDQFGFRRGKGGGDATGKLRIISQRTLDIDGELCTCFIDW
jgi:hypothetical protein